MLTANENPIKVDKKHKRPVFCAVSVLYLGVFLLNQSCGAEIKSQSKSKESGLIDSQKNELSVSATLIHSPSKTLYLDSEGTQVPLTKKEQEIGLNLMSSTGLLADSYVVVLGGCSSGLTGTSALSETIRVYIQDTNCVGQLISIVLGGQSYIPSGSSAVPFSNYKEGESAIFQGASSKDLINVKVVHQLSSPVQSEDKIAYSFEIIPSEASSSVSANGQNIFLTGTSAPNFKIKPGDASLVSIISSGPSAGAGTFIIKLTCSTGPMTEGANPNYNSFCPDEVERGKIAEGDSGVDLGLASHFSYKLIPDPNGDGTLTMEQAQAAFKEGGDSNVTLTSDLLPDATGFQTVTLTGPVTLASNPKMILILQAKSVMPTLDNNNPENSSYQYFPIVLDLMSP